MSTTRAGLRTIIREVLPDATVWIDSLLNQWINDALADFSTYFPRRLTATVACVADQREYTLSLTNLHSITRVEYPKGEDPPEYLERRDVNDPRGFWDGDFYDVWGDPPEILVIGDEPSAGEDIEVTYFADHDYPTDDADVLTVPDGQLEALVLFVRWKAFQLLQAVEAADPDTTTILLSQLDMAVFRAERAYRTKIGDLRSQEAQSATIQWDLGDRWQSEEWA